MGREDSLVLVDNLSSDGVTTKALVVVTNGYHEWLPLPRNFKNHINFLDIFGIGQ